MHFKHPELTVFTANHKVVLLEWVNHVVQKIPRMLKCLNGQDVDMHLMTISLLEGNFRPIKKLSHLSSNSAPAALVTWTESSAAGRIQRNLKVADRDANTVRSRYILDDTLPSTVVDVLRVLTPVAQDIILEELRRRQDLDVHRIAEDKYLVVLSGQAISDAEKLASRHPHLYTWTKEDDDVLVIVCEDAGGVRRLRCSCFTCK